MHNSISFASNYFYLGFQKEETLQIYVPPIFRTGCNESCKQTEPKYMHQLEQMYAFHTLFTLVDLSKLRRVYYAVSELAETRELRETN